MLSAKTSACQHFTSVFLHMPTWTLYFSPCVWFLIASNHPGLVINTNAACKLNGCSKCKQDAMKPCWCSVLAQLLKYSSPFALLQQYDIKWGWLIRRTTENQCVSQGGITEVPTAATWLAAGGIRMLLLIAVPIHTYTQKRLEWTCTEDCVSQVVLCH